MLKNVHSKLRSSPEHRNTTRSSEIESERSCGNRRPALMIVSLLLVGTTAIAAPPTTTGPMSDPCALKPVVINCPEGEVWLKDAAGNKLKSECNIWTDKKKGATLDKPGLGVNLPEGVFSWRHIDANGI